MQEKELIGKIKELRNIKPSQNWVSFTKAKVLGEEPKVNWLSVLEFFPRLVYKHSKLAFASLIIFGFVAGAFGFAQGALPGDPTYTLKRVSEKISLAFISENDLPYAQLELANKRLEELNTIAQTNQVKKIAPAVQEFQANISKAVKDLANVQNIDIDTIVSKTKKIQENRQKIESLGIIIGDTPDLDNVLLEMIQSQIKDLQVSSLTDEQKTVFARAVADFEAGNYSDSLEKILLLSHPQ
ncbi:MAG: DUF5667 domain-containing protein [Patescibacteria group bacterium]